MTMLCSVVGHAPQSTQHHNQGLDFAVCHRCACDLIRADEAGEWTEVPKGFRVVWREFGRAGDAASVAARMQRAAPPPPRRAPRNARPKRRRDPRGNPVKGVTTVIGTLVNLGKLVRGDVEDRPDLIEDNGQYVICLPGGR